MYCLSPTGVCSFFVRSCRGGTGFSGRLMPAGHLLFCATKKGDKKVAGNAIPRSRLPSERKIAHSRSSSLYPYFDTNVRSRECFLNLRLFRTSTGGNQPQLHLHVGPGAAKRHKKSMVSFDGLTKTPVKSWVEPPADLGLPTSRRRAGRRLECGNPPKRGKACPTSIELYAPSS